MTAVNPCPDVVLLSSLLDGELAGSELDSVKAHLQSCTACSELMGELKRVDRMMINDVEIDAGSRANFRSPNCMSGEQLSSYFHDLLPADDKSAAEHHLDQCDGCLSELAAMAKVEAQLSRMPTEPVPHYLRQRVESLWQTSETAGGQVIKLVCRLAKEGIELLRESLLPDGLSLQPAAVVAGTYRTAGPSLPSNIFVKGRIAGIQLSLLAERHGANSAGLKLKIEDESSNSLTARRIVLRRDEILLISERTDADGNVFIPNLEPGTYKIGITISGKECTIDFELRNN